MCHQKIAESNYEILLSFFKKRNKKIQQQLIGQMET